MKDPTRDHPEIVTWPPLIFLIPFLLGLLLHVPFPLRSAPRLPRGLGWGPLIGGVLLGAWAGWTMTRAGTAVNPAKPATALVTSGPFRYTRNPLYLCDVLVYAGLTNLTRTIWPWLLLPIALAGVRLGVIDPEERYLTGKFGDEYRRYQASVRRWL